MPRNHNTLQQDCFTRQSSTTHCNAITPRHTSQRKVTFDAKSAGEVSPNKSPFSSGSFAEETITGLFCGQRLAKEGGCVCVDVVGCSVLQCVAGETCIRASLHFVAVFCKEVTSGGRCSGEGGVCGDTHSHTHTPLAEDTAGMLAFAVRFSLLTRHAVACAAAVEEEAGGAGFAVWALRLVLRFTCLFWVSLCVLSSFFEVFHCECCGSCCISPACSGCCCVC